MLHLLAALVERFEISLNGDAGLSEFLDLAPRLGHHLFARGNGFGLVRDSIRKRFHPSETFLEALQELDFVLDVIDVALLCFESSRQLVGALDRFFDLLVFRSESSKVVFELGDALIDFHRAFVGNLDLLFEKGCGLETLLDLR